MRVCASSLFHQLTLRPLSVRILPELWSVSACLYVPSSSSVASVQVNESEIDDPNKPLSLGDFVEDSAPLRVPTAVCQAACPSQATQVNYMSLRPQHAKHRHPIEQQHQQLNSIYSLPQWYMYRLHLLIT